MDIPVVSDPKWAEIVNGAHRYEFDFLAAKVLVGSLIIQVKYHPENLTTCIETLRNLFLRNAQLPSAKRDLQKIFG